MIKCLCGFIPNSPADYSVKEMLSMEITSDGKEIHTVETFDCPQCGQALTAFNVYTFHNMNIER